MESLENRIKLRGENLARRMFKDLIMDFTDITITLAKGEEEGESIKLAKDLLTNTISLVRDLKLEDKSIEYGIEGLLNYLKKVSFEGYKLNENKEGQLILFNDLLEFGKAIGLERYKEIKKITLDIDREIKPKTYDELVRKLNVVGLTLGESELITLENFSEILEVLKKSPFELLDETYRRITFNVGKGVFKIEDEDLDKLKKLHDCRMPY